MSPKIVGRKRQFKLLLPEEVGSSSFALGRTKENSARMCHCDVGVIIWFTLKNKLINFSI